MEEEALRLFAERGVDGTSVRDIAQAAGVAEGALYRHFASKEALARELFLSRYAVLARQIEDIAGRVPDFEGRIRAVVEHACRLFDEAPALFTFLLIAQHDHLAHVPDRQGNAVAALAQIMADAQVAGVRLPQPVDLAAAMALGAVVQPAVFAVYGRLARPLGGHAGAIAEGVLSLLTGTR
ncbi:helix-turn-helix transcriptional regulator [Ancylobacter lacus]|nr:helix-turn-helix transcriptional regulator [Ancylobacter lacus]